MASRVGCGAAGPDDHVRAARRDPPRARRTTDRGPVIPLRPRDREADAAADPVPDADAVWREAWAVAAEQLVAEAATCTVEDLLRTARAVRDTLDPDGAARRFDDRFRARSFRMWVRRARHPPGFDQLRRRDGGVGAGPSSTPRCVPAAADPGSWTPTKPPAPGSWRRIPRTNDQLTYDLIMDTLRAGALADTEQVFGTRQAGIRVVITAAALHTVPGGPGHRCRGRRARGRPIRGHRNQHPGVAGPAATVRHRADHLRHRPTRQPALPRSGATPVLRQATTRPRDPGRRLPMAGMRPATLLLRSPPHRPLRPGRGPHRHRPRHPALPVPPHATPPRRLADHPHRTRTTSPSTHPARRRRSPSPRNCTSATPGQASNRHPDDSGPPPESGGGRTRNEEASGDRVGAGGGCRPSLRVGGVRPAPRGRDPTRVATARLDVGPHHCTARRATRHAQGDNPRGITHGG